MQEIQGVDYLDHPLIWPNTVEFRTYQKKIAERASLKNTLVVLPTALGKTVISAIVAANQLYFFRTSKVLVMAPTKPLVIQHRTNFLKMLKLRNTDTALLTGETSPEHRCVLWESPAKLIFSTPQVVRNDLLENRVTLENFGLLIFDECHRAVKKYAYTEIARFYMSQVKFPLILGMTASPGSKIDRVLEICRNLFIEQVEYRSENDPDVTPYLHEINVEWVTVELPRKYVEIKSQIRSMLDKSLIWLYHTGVITSRPKYVTRTQLIEVGHDLRALLEESAEAERGRIFTAIIHQSLALTLFHMVELIETQGIRTLQAFMEKISKEKGEKRSYMMLVRSSEYQNLIDLVETDPVEHPKFEALRQLVQTQLHEQPKSRMLVFTQYRDTATQIVTELRKVSGVRAMRFVGQASTLHDKGLTQKEQIDRLRNLEEGVLNVLVATSIAEEGLDIPSVDKVIFFEPIPSEIRYIQRRGRTGRKSAGSVTILVAEESLDMIYLYASKRKAEKMQKIIEDLKKRLQPIIRLHPPPSQDPLTASDLRSLDTEAYRERNGPEQRTTDDKTSQQIQRTVEKKARKLYLKLLESGENGADLEQMRISAEFENTPRPLLKAAIGNLQKKGLITPGENGKYVIRSAKEKTKGQVFEVTVEKVYPGEAAVIVDNTINARIMPEDFTGPRTLIKKNSTFQVIGELYKIDGILYLRVYHVRQSK